jgi:hypothetical protein
MAKIAFSGFAWDRANRLKCQKHGVSILEIEYVLAHAESLMSYRPDPDTAMGLCCFHATAKRGRHAPAAAERSLYAREGDQEV